MSDTELKALLQSVLAGPSRAALVTALTTALGPGLTSTSPDEPTSGMSPTIALRSAIFEMHASAAWSKALHLAMIAYDAICISLLLACHGRIVGCCPLVLADCTYNLLYYVQAQGACVVSVLSCAFVHIQHAAHSKAGSQILRRKNNTCDLDWNAAAGAWM